MAAPALPFPLPRRVDPASATGTALAAHLRVHPDCIAIWTLGRAAGRSDTYIGLIDTVNWQVYLAPCFGVPPAMIPAASSANERAVLIVSGSFSPQTVLISNATSARVSRSIGTRKDQLETVYGAGNVCYVELPENLSFDGKSHQAMSRWVIRKWGVVNLDWSRALGFALQKDETSYYIRYASTLNERPGQSSGDTFVPRLTAKADREPRDLPKYWAGILDNALQRDLHLGALSPKQRMQSRDEHQTTKLTRFV